MKNQRVSKALCASVVVLGLSACSPGGSEPEVSINAPTTPQFAPLGADEILARLSALPPRTLQAGQCGLFLWLKREDAPLVFHQQSDGTATLAVDGAVGVLERTSQERLIAQSFYETQSFLISDLTIKVTLEPEQKRSLQQGMKIPTGKISIEDSAGWSAALPVGGLIGCQ